MNKKFQFIDFQLFVITFASGTVIPTEKLYQKGIIMKKLSLCIVLCGFAMACTKFEEPSSKGPNASVESLSEISVDPSFNWSNSIKGAITAQVNSDNLHTEGSTVYLKLGDQRLAQTKVKNGFVEFYASIPQTSDQLYLEFPGTNETVLAKVNDSQVFAVGDQDRYALLDDTLSNSTGKKSAMAKTMANVLINGDFEIDDIGEDDNAYWILRTTGKWYSDDFSDGERTIESGSNVYKSTKNSSWVGIYQAVAGYENTSYTASFDYYSNSGNKVKGYVDFFDGNGNWLGYHTFSRSASSGTGVGTLSGTTPANTAYLQVNLFVRKYSWVDNVSLDITNPAPDADNDGVADADDAYPNDPARAYNSYFPTTGYQTLAFEDLWPFQGDYDFNDVVISNQVNWVRNANNELVEANFSISLDAVGSGYTNGLAIVLLDANKNVIAQNIIASVSGDASADPDVTNGIVVFNDVFAAQSTYYQNNGEGPSAPADVFTFTVTFNANAGTQDLLPDTYIYRTDDRGLEVHLDGFTGTSMANVSYYNTGDDVNGTYNTSSGLPWAIEIVSANKSFAHPNEKIDITQAYPSFQNWAESEGTQSTDWLDNLVNNLVFNTL